MSAIMLKSGLPIYFSQKSFSLDMPTTKPAQTPRLLAFKRRIKSLAFTESVALGLQGPRASNGVIFKDPLLDRMLDVLWCDEGEESCRYLHVTWRKGEDDVWHFAVIRQQGLKEELLVFGNDVHVGKSW